MTVGWLKNPTAVLMVLLTIGFIWVQWPTRENTAIPQQKYLVEQSSPDYRIQFEDKPEIHEVTSDDQRAILYVLSRRKMDFMLQEITPGTINTETWLAQSKRSDLTEFSGKLVTDWQFQRDGVKVYEYILTNELHFVTQVRVIFTPDAIFKLAVGFKQSDDPELMARVLGFLDSFSI